MNVHLVALEWTRPDWCRGRLVHFADGDVEADFGFSRRQRYGMSDNGASDLLFVGLGGAEEDRLLFRAVTTFARAAQLLDYCGDPLPVEGPRLRALEWTEPDECRGRFAHGTEVAFTIVRNGDDIGVRGEPDVLADAPAEVRELVESAVVLLCRSAQGEVYETD